ncbi:hypothetical protein AURDEDRAFT_189150 [Auricularia subglabra TFB-10046 SS5]|uniref:Uncharacterized protein n=1 Tax=Auricularia subglabra (strain TFB-10046 / SS5) TaxID=717982 RepID=J0L7I1_AURST|nr:hypothetical protein AURDEDRAFT_189150 [Auricularia subglabra TFB-10046 SS5]
MERKRETRRSGENNHQVCWEQRQWQLLSLARAETASRAPDSENARVLAPAY